MTVLTLTCILCGGSGREPLGEITVKCHVCNGVGSVPAPGVASELAAPMITLDDLARQVRQLQEAVAAMLDVETMPLVSRRKLAAEIRQEMNKLGVTP